MHPLVYILVNAPVNTRENAFRRGCREALSYNKLLQEVDSMDDLQLYKREERTLRLHLPSPLERCR